MNDLNASKDERVRGGGEEGRRVRSEAQRRTRVLHSERRKPAEAAWRKLAGVSRRRGRGEELRVLSTTEYFKRWWCRCNVAGGKVNHNAQKACPA